MKINTDLLQPDSYYHIYNRGVNGESIFKEKKNFNYFLTKYNQHINMIANTYSYCLMKNHFHFLIKTKTEDSLRIIQNPENKSSSWLIGNQFSSLFKGYSSIINKTYNRTGGLFENVFRRKEIDSDEYFARLIYYIHSNPQHHNVCEDFRKYPHCSYNSILSTRPTRLMRKEVLDWFGGKDEYVKFHNSDYENESIKKYILE